MSWRLPKSEIFYSPEPRVGQVVYPAAPPPGWRLERLVGWKGAIPDPVVWRVVRWQREAAGYAVVVAPFRG
jgi:hypothetical protein